MEKINVLQASVNSIAEIVLKIQQEKKITGKWISEKDLLALPGLSLSRSTLLKMRKKGLIRSSTLTGKQNFYRTEDFEKLLNKNEEEM